HRRGAVGCREEHHTEIVPERCARCRSHVAFYKACDSAPVATGSEGFIGRLCLHDRLWRCLLVHDLVIAHPPVVHRFGPVTYPSTGTVTTGQQPKAADDSLPAVIRLGTI